MLTTPAPRGTSSPSRFLENLNKREIPSLYGLRGIAALIVILSHYSYDAPVRWLFPAGYAVSLFFILSGLLITWLLLKEHDKTGSVSLRQFYARRSLRLFPAFYVVWAICAVTVHHFPEKWPTFFYMGDYYLAVTGAYGPLTIAWSLGIEEKFYLLWPTLFRGTDRKQLVWWVVAVIALDQLYRSVLTFTGHDLYASFSFDANLDCILIGCLIALLAHRGFTPPRWMGWPLMPVCAVLCLYTCPAFVVHYALALLLIWSVLKGPWFLNNRVTRYLGLVSYSLYLCHLIAEQLVWMPLFGSVHFSHWSYGLFSKVAVALICASVLHFAVERPFLRLKDRFHRKAAAATSSLERQDHRAR